MPNSAESRKPPHTQACSWTGTLPDGPWLDHLDPDYLARTYPSWAGGVTTVEEAAQAFRQIGFAELATIAEGFEFDPVYYAEANPAWEGAHERERYRSWLLEGLATGRPGSPAAHLRMLGLELDDYPPGFPWEYYVRLRPSAGAHRWAALQDFCTTGFADLRLEMSFGPDAAAFLCALGRMYSRQNDGLAIRAYEFARSLAPIPAIDQQHLADAYLREGVWRPALDLYQGIVRNGEESAWTLRNLVKCLRELGLSDALLPTAKAVRGRFYESLLWQAAAEESVNAIFEADSCRARRLMAAGRHKEADDLLNRSVAELACVLAGPDKRRPKHVAPKTPKVLILFNEDEQISVRRRVTERTRQLDRLEVAHSAFPLREAERFVAEFPAASAIILFRIPALVPMLRCIMLARWLGISVYYETDDDLLDPANVPEIGEFRGRIDGALYDDLRYGASLCRAAARLSDYGIAPTIRVAKLVRPLVGSRRCFVIPDTLLEPKRAVDGVAGTDRRNRRLFARVESLTFLDALPGTLGGEILALLQRRADIELGFAGPLHLDRQFDTFHARIRQLGAEPHTSAYRPYLAESDVNLLLQRATPREEYHAEIGWREAAALSIPSLMLMPSATLPELRDEENVMRAATVPAWTARLERMLADCRLCERIAKQAWRDAVARHASERTARALRRALTEGERMARPR